MSILEIAAQDRQGEDTGAVSQQPAKDIVKVSASRRWTSRYPPGLILASIILLIVVSWALVPSVFTAYDPLQGTPSEHLRAPSLSHLLGTDSLGRDLYARMVYGAVHSLSGALAAVAIGLVVGSVIGILAGSIGRWVDAALMRFIDVLLSIPVLLLSLSVIILLGFGTVHAAIAVGVTSIANFARLVRSEVLSVRRSEYVEAAFGSGGTFRSVVWRHVLPNSMTTVIPFAALQTGWAILQLSTLGFLGYGAPPPTPEWGLLIAEGRNYIATAWWLTTAPGILVVLVVVSINRLSQSMRRVQR
ncbi:MAG: ABC transporter permease [Pantoea sp.]|uniref:ABC transporter permease n=1 Tax=Pantoea sp. TaxID=69393 RepID=UPI002396837B|nr:ABC transporter permease [Pantoea sp.]MDE1187105.1 ABC transporter permease [Pantoea sp.]